MLCKVGEDKAEAEAREEKVLLFRGQGLLQLSPEVMRIQKRLLFMLERKVT